MSNRARVLFVDDEQRVLNSMRAMFRREFDLFLASDGAAAVKIAAANAIDVIVADQRMPGMSGVEVLDIVKRISPQTMRILLTGYADTAAIEGSINVGEVFRYLSKPCPTKELRETLRLAVRATRAVGESRARRLSSTREQPTAAYDSDALVDLPLLPVAPAVDEDSQEQRVKDVGVVIYTVDAVFAETAIRTISNEHNTMLATSLVKAMQALEQDSSGVLITDITTDFLRLHRIIAALKQHVPDLVTIVVSDGRDSSNMISLINYGQIFRFELKPVTPSQLRVDINAAAQKHVTLRNKPNLERRYRVNDLPDDKHAGLYTSDYGAITDLRERRARTMNGPVG